MEDQITKATKILNKGGIIIFPTDTAFGIGCRIDNTDAIKRLFTLRKRPENKATPVLVSSREMAQEYLQPIPETVKKELIDRFWPGALTIVLSSKMDKVPDLVRGGTNTLGVRMPDHDVTLEIIEKVGVPILGTSANFHGGSTPYSFEELDPELVKLVDFVVKGECIVKEASTVIDCTKEPWEVLREGAVRIEI